MHRPVWQVWEVVRQRNLLASELGDAAPSVPLKKFSSRGAAPRLPRPDRAGRSASVYFPLCWRVLGPTL